MSTAGPPDTAPARADTDSGYVLTLGETMALFRTVQPGPLAQAASADIGIGGSESNVAIGLQRLGVQAIWCGRIGADALGERVRREIRAEGVDARIHVDPEAPTGLMVKEQRTASMQRVNYYRSGSAGSRIHPADVPRELIANAALVHLTGITLALSESAAQTWHHVATAARKAGVPVSMDLNYRRALWPPEAAARAYAEALPLVDILFAGEDEAAIAAGAPGDAPELARLLAARGPAQVIIKQGAEGAYGLIDGQEYRQHAVPINPLDTVGAGDAFVAGYLSETVRGKSPQSRLRTAAQTGAFACLSPGDWEGLPRRDELELLEATEPVTR